MSTNINIHTVNEDEGPILIRVNDEELCRASYDEDGSQGMRKLVKLTEDIAEAFGVEVTKTYGGDE